MVAMTTTAVSVVSTVFVLNIHHSKYHHKTRPNRVTRFVFFDIFGCDLCRQRCYSGKGTKKPHGPSSCRTPADRKTSSDKHVATVENSVGVNDNFPGKVLEAPGITTNETVSIGGGDKFVEIGKVEEDLHETVAEWQRIGKIIDRRMFDIFLVAQIASFVLCVTAIPNVG